MFMWANSLIKNIVKRSILKVYLFISKLKKRELNLKDREKLENVHDVVYQAKCPDCSETYIGLRLDLWKIIEGVLFHNISYIVKPASRKIFIL